MIYSSLINIFSKIILALFYFVQITLIGINSDGDGVAILTSVSNISIGVGYTVMNDIFLSDLVRSKLQGTLKDFCLLNTAVVIVLLIGSLATIPLFVYIANLMIPNHSRFFNPNGSMACIFYAYSLNIPLAVLANFGRNYMIVSRGLNKANVISILQGIISLIAMFSLYPLINVLAPIFGLILSNFLTVFLVTAYMRSDNIFSFGANWSYVKNCLINRNAVILVFAHSISLFVQPSLEWLASGFGPGLASGFSACWRVVQVLQGLVLGSLFETVSIGIMRLHFSGRRQIGDLCEKLLQLTVVISISGAIFLSVLCLNWFQFVNGKIISNASAVLVGKTVLPILVLTLPASFIIGFNSRIFYIYQDISKITYYGVLTQLLIISFCFILSRKFGITVLAYSKLFLESGIMVPMSMSILAEKGCYKNLKVWFAYVASEIMIVVFIYAPMLIFIISKESFNDGPAIFFTVEIVFVLSSAIVGYRVWKKCGKILDKPAWMEISAA